jgi:sulfur carrier protein ThiS adenylyltransferase
MRYPEIRSHLSNFWVGIAGAGGLGSNCAIALARCGVGNLIICDFDVVEDSNLNRQYYFREQLGMLKVIALKQNISRIDPRINVEAVNEKLDLGNIPTIFKDCHVIVEALDSADMKEMMIETSQSKLSKIPLIAASGVAGWGNPNEILCRKVDDTFYICGDGKNEESSELPAIAPHVAIVANMQADIVIELLMSMRI